jgi:hypothetical protein
VRQQRCLDLRLAEDEQERIGSVVGLDVGEQHGQVAAVEVQLHPGRPVAAIQQRLGDPDRPEDLQGARLDDQGS